jgi:nucleotide-binding universal stress UspA family protein
VIERELKHYESVLAGMRDKLAGNGIDAHAEVVVGHPAEQILRYAETHGIDHIIVGNRGRSLFERLLLGSIARQVVAHAPCNVTIVRA